MALTDIKIKSLKPKAKPYKIAYGDGLHILVHPNGSKYWRLKYRYLGKERVMAIGVYPEITIQMAKDKKNDARQLLRDGKDPNTEKANKKRTARYNSNNTFSAVAKEWHDLNKHKWTDKYIIKVWNRIERYALPAVGNKPISEVSGLEILDDIIRPIEKNGLTETSHALLQNCSAIFRLAVLTKRAPYNPISDMRGVLQVHKVKHLPAIKIKELPAFLKKLEAHNTRDINKLAIRMLLLVFLRSGELRRLKWEYFDFKKKICVVPLHLMKKRIEHTVPLSKQVLAILEEIKKISGDNEYLFPAINKIKNPYMNENTINKIIKDMGYKGKMVGHGFRTIASTELNELGYRKDVIEAQLSHKDSDQVRAAYNRAEYINERARMMQGWANHIDELAYGKKDNKVLKFSKKR